MAVTGTVTLALPAGEGASYYALPRSARGEAQRVAGDELSRGPRTARRPQPDHADGATILEFPDRFAAQLDDDNAFHAASDPRARVARLISTAPTGAFLAQHIAQERLGSGVFLDPHPQATAAYARGNALARASAAMTLDFAV